MINFAKFISCLLFLVATTIGFGQVENYSKINIQGQLLTVDASAADFEFLIKSITGDTIWREEHNAVGLSELGVFTLELGAGELIESTVPEFHQINWLIVGQVELYTINGVRVLQGAFATNSVPYAAHSLHVLKVPALQELIDVSGETVELNQTIKFDGIEFIFGNDETGDTANYVWNADSVIFADTAFFAFNNQFADTAIFAYFSDSALVALTMDSVLTTSNSIYADSTTNVLYSKGNWSKFGDDDLVDDPFLGSISPVSFSFRTNNRVRLVFGDDYSVNNNVLGSGFRFSTTRGALFVPNATYGIDSISDAYLYFDGGSYSFHGGSNVGPIDTLKGMYSFAFGENVGTNGIYSTVFGKNTFGDTAYYDPVTPYASISSFALGRDCRVAHMSVAIGDSAIANYYRNVAIGKKVISTSFSSGLGIGNNIYITGATAWAVGHNLTATGHFSTAMGTNASTNGRAGSFVYGDASTIDTVKNTANHQFMVRAAGGYIFYSSVDLTMGVELLPGAGSWSMISDRNKKTNLVLLNPIDYQPQFKQLEVLGWNYIGVKDFHIGPMAQDFYQTFGVGEAPIYINMIDSDGVTFLGIKKLNEQLNQLTPPEEIETLKEGLEQEKKELLDLERRIKELYEELDTN
jgi:hypothetical protein